MYDMIFVRTASNVTVKYGPPSPYMEQVLYGPPMYGIAIIWLPHMYVWFPNMYDLMSMAYGPSILYME